MLMQQELMLDKNSDCNHITGLHNAVERLFDLIEEFQVRACQSLASI